MQATHGAASSHWWGLVVAALVAFPMARLSCGTPLPTQNMASSVLEGEEGAGRMWLHKSLLSLGTVSHSPHTGSQGKMGRRWELGWGLGLAVRAPGLSPPLTPEDGTLALRRPGAGTELGWAWVPEGLIVNQDPAHRVPGSGGAYGLG